MSISQHIAGIRSRTAQNRASMSPEEVGGDELMQSDKGHANPERSSQSHEHDLSLKTSSTGINEEGNLKESPQTASPFASLEQIDFAHDGDDKLKQINIIDRLERRWIDLNTNLEATLNHLQDCSYQVTESSLACLDSLKGSVETTCDKVDGELKVFYHLMTKCDELSMKLSIAGSFRDEIKTLRKSVETLEQLYKK